MAVRNVVHHLVDSVATHLSAPEAARPAAPAPDLQAAVDAARREWLTARTYFDSVADPDLIDHAIYAMEAAERKYVFLLRCAREAGDLGPRCPADG